jgi:hypothetical protein
MFKLQYTLSLALHWLCRASGLERLVLGFSRSRAAAYLRAQGLSELLESDLSYGKPLLELEDRTKVVDLARLHRMVRAGRFKAIREYGAGASTIAIAHAMANGRRRDQTLVTVEESQEWLDSVLGRLHSQARDRVTGLVANYVPTGGPGSSMESDLALNRAIPGIPDLVYVDGPTLYAVGQLRGVPLIEGWREPINVDVLSVAHTMRKGSVIIFDERPASYWAVLRGLRRPLLASSSSLFSVNRITLL